MPVDLAIQLREGTKKAHTMAENTGFVSCFLKGVVEKSSYRKLLTDLFLVYSVMEDEVGRLCEMEHPVISKIGFQELNRKKSLEQDLAFYFGNDWLSELQPSTSAEKYVERIKKVASEIPELLVGHHYTRYIGDLSGGQILKKIAQKAMNLTENDGLRFYEFDQISDEKAFKNNYKITLDSLPIDQEMADLIVKEANLAYQFNMNIFKELEGNIIKAIGLFVFRLITSRKVKGSTE